MSTALSPAEQRWNDPRWGWAATLRDVDRHTAELIAAVEAWEQRDRERPDRFYALATQITNAARNLDADTSQLARLSHGRRR